MHPSPSRRRRQRVRIAAPLYLFFVSADSALPNSRNDPASLNSADRLSVGGLAIQAFEVLMELVSIETKLTGLKSR
jgi:hypothetical protein